MDVGINYPWYDYGWDFGDAPPGWRTASDPNWRLFIDNEIQYLTGLGIRVVRWFIFGDGLTYGTGSQAPHKDARRPGKWRFDDPPQLSQNFQAHFRTLLERFTIANQKSGTPLLLLPVLLDFKFCQSGSPARVQGSLSKDWIKRGRKDIIIDSQKRHKFLQRALDPLLKISQSHRPSIYAWDIFNEPEWVTNGWHPNGTTGLPVDKEHMRQFLKEAMDRIRSAGFKVTIGFNRIDTIRSTKIYADYNQFHHYTKGDRKLDKHSFDKRFPGIIGEFATSTNDDHWPELGSADQSVLNRLRYAKKWDIPGVSMVDHRGLIDILHGAPKSNRTLHVLPNVETVPHEKPDLVI